MFTKNDMNNLKSNMLLSGICKPLSMLISYIYIPIVLNYLGIEKYGIWSTILTIISWIGYFDIGIGNGLRNKLTESLSKKDGESQKLVSSAYAFTTLIMIVVVIIFSAVASCVNWNRVFGVDNTEENLAKVVIISAIFIAVNFILSLCKNVLYALQKSADVSIMELMVQIINLIGVIIASKFFESNLFIMAIVYGNSMIVVNCVASIVVYEKNKAIRPRIHGIDMLVGRNITNLGTQFFVVQICALVLFTTDSLIISYLYGAADVTPYNTVNKLFNVIIGIYSALIVPIWSNVTKMKAENNIVGIRRLIGKLHLLMIPFIMMSIILSVLLRKISAIWLGKELNYSTELIIFGCLYCVLTMWCNTYASISNGMEIMKITMVFACIQATVNIPLSLFMAESLNLKTAGVLGGTVTSMIIAAAVSPFIVNRKLNELSRGNLK